MENYNSRNSLVIDDKLSQYLENQGPTVLHEEPGGLSTIEQGGARAEGEQFSEDIIIPPLNTDIRFSEYLPLHTPTEAEAEGHSHSHPHAIVQESFLQYAVDHADEEGSSYAYDPHKHDHPSEKHSRELHTHEHTHENFSWAISTDHDSPLDLVKKSLISKVNTQHACGSCWDI